MKSLIILSVLLCGHIAHTQPYVDIVNLRYQHSPDVGLTNKDNRSNRFDYYNASLNIPLIFKKDSSLIVLSPFADIWRIHAEAAPELPDLFQSFAFPVSVIKPLNDQWSLTMTVIPRWNGYNAAWFDNNDFQMGGALLATYKKTQTLRYKFGIYYNSEFSGPFIMPLLGIDWQINEKNNLFGVLPGHFVFEHKVTKRFYWGASFHSITNSYKAGNLDFSLIQRYVRMQES